MARSIKLDNNDYVDASGVWDSTLGMSQEDFNKRFAVVVMTTPQSQGWVTTNLPNGFTVANCVIIGWQVAINGGYRTGNGMSDDNEPKRILVNINSSSQLGVYLADTNSVCYGQTIKITLYKYQ